MTVIRTARLLLRRPELADAASISLLAGDYDVASMTGTIPHPYNADMAETWINGVHEGAEGIAFAIDLGGDLIGCVGYRARGADHAEMGYWLGKPYWGRGYATEAATALILHAFAAEAFDYLTAGHFKENPASARVIAKLGFLRSGEVKRDCAAMGRKARCLIYKLPRERALMVLRATLTANTCSGV